MWIDTPHIDADIAHRQNNGQESDKDFGDARAIVGIWRWVMDAEQTQVRRARRRYDDKVQLVN